MVLIGKWMSICSAYGETGLKLTKWINTFFKLSSVMFSDPPVMVVNRSWGPTRSNRPIGHNHEAYRFI